MAEKRKEGFKAKGDISDFLLRLELAEKPRKVEWDDVLGLQEAKKALNENCLWPLRFPDYFTGIRTPRNSILLYGPPGTGKTLLAHALATEAEKSIFIPLSNRYDKNERLLENLLVNRTRVPTIILIDDIDVLFSSESAIGTKVKLLRYLQYREFLGPAREYDGILILATAREPWLLDQPFPLLKKFESRIYTPLPNTTERLRIFKCCLGETPHRLTEENLEELAKKTEGYSGGDISVLVQETLKQPIRMVKGASHYKRFSGPSCSDPNVIVKDMLIPCSPDCPRTIKISLEKIPNNKLLEPTTNMVSHPSRYNLKVGDLLTPCSPDSPKAIAISWEEFPKHMLLGPVITMRDMLHSLARSKPSICKDGLRTYEKLQELFC